MIKIMKLKSYCFKKILGGWLTYKFGPKIVFLASMFLGSIGTILVPVCAHWNFYALIFCRFLTGAAQVLTIIIIKTKTF